MTKRGITFFLLIVLLSPLSTANIILNEIMANPITDEDLNEWVELYNNGSSSVNVSGWKIGDNNGNDTLEGAFYNQQGTIIPSFGYAIVTDDATRVYDNFNVSKDAIHLYVDDSSIGNGLSNSGETLYLYNGTILIDKITYSPTNDDKTWAYVNGVWQEANATPGYNNNGSVTVTSVNPDTCDWKIENILNKTIFDNSSDFSFKVRATNLLTNKTNLTAVSIIEDSSGNIVQSYNLFSNDTATSQKTSSTYTPNLAENQIYFIKTNLTTQCNDTYQDNNYVTSMFSIRSSATLNPNSYLNIQNIYDLGSDKKAKFGQTIKVRINAYKGNTTKESISLYLQKGSGKITKESSTNLENKFTNYTLTIPLQLVPNCNRDFEDGTYTLYAEGLDQTAASTVEVEDITDDLCEEIEVEKEAEIKRSKIYVEIVDAPGTVKVGEEFTVRLKLDNDDSKRHSVEVWSYVYRGSKSYSGDRELNKRLVALPKEDTELVELRNSILDAEEGDYRLKINYKREDQKTIHDITRIVKAIASSENIPKVKISKFYSNDKNSLGEAVLLASLENQGRQSFNGSLILQSLFHNEMKEVILDPDSADLFEFSVPVVGGNNIFYLQLKQKDKILGMEDLVIVKNESSVYIIEDTIDLFSSANYLPALQNTMTANAILTSRPNAIAYESSNEKAKKLVPYIIVAVTTLISILIIVSDTIYWANK